MTCVEVEQIKTDYVNNVTCAVLNSKPFVSATGLLQCADRGCMIGCGFIQFNKDMSTLPSYACTVTCSIITVAGTFNPDTSYGSLCTRVSSICVLDTLYYCDTICNCVRSVSVWRSQYLPSTDDACWDASCADSDNSKFNGQFTLALYTGPGCYPLCHRICAYLLRRGGECCCCNWYKEGGATDTYVCLISLTQVYGSVCLYEKCCYGGNV